MKVTDLIDALDKVSERVEVENERLLRVWGNTLIEYVMVKRGQYQLISDCHDFRGIAGIAKRHIEDEDIRYAINIRDGYVACDTKEHAEAYIQFSNIKYNNGKFKPSITKPEPRKTGHQLIEQYHTDKQAQEEMTGFTIEQAANKIHDVFRRLGIKSKVDEADGKWSAPRFGYKIEVVNDLIKEVKVTPVSWGSSEYSVAIILHRDHSDHYRNRRTWELEDVYPTTVKKIKDLIRERQDMGYEGNKSWVVFWGDEGYLIPIENKYTIGLIRSLVSDSRL